MNTALIVEDEPLMREYLMANLTNIHKNWKTTGCAKDGAEAVELLEKQKYDVVITDIKMPRMSGLELAKYISNNHKEIPVIMLTGYNEFDYARSAIRSGVMWNFTMLWIGLQRIMKSQLKKLRPVGLCRKTLLFLCFGQGSTY